MYEGLQQHFNVTALGEGRYFLGIEIERDAIGLHLNQKQNILKLEHYVQDLQRNSIEELPNRKYVSRFFYQTSEHPKVEDITRKDNRQPLSMSRRSVEVKRHLILERRRQNK